MIRQDALIMLGEGWLLTATLFFLLWLLQVRTKNASWVDVGWVFGLVIFAAVYLISGNGFFPRRLIAFILPALWALRLGSHLITRIMNDKEEDRRYQKIRADWKIRINEKFFLFFQFEGFLDLILSIPFLLMALNPAPALTWLEILGVLIWIVGFVGEVIADKQLKAFKSSSLNQGQICDVGLWYYSRHPNYFFEWVMWLAYFIMALSSPDGWIAIICPIIMIFFLLKVSGVPLAEAQALKTKGDAYKEYQRRTSMFIPWFKRP